ncbi:MAG TPA: T9SS type A sorting domain-containing protein [Ignavibacteria bacterium]|nr:T9SS type A sorting domain-containing protein [Ignavibacteria bacterium]
MQRFVIVILIIFSFNSPILGQLNEKLIFVSRNITQGGSIHFANSSLLPGMGPYSRFKIVGGSLNLRNTDGSIITLIDSSKVISGIRLIDIQQPNVHWSGEKIIFAGVEHRDSNWRIYELDLESNNLKKLTKTDRNINLSQFGIAANKFLRYDDIDPVYYSNDKIYFASTRFPTLSQIDGFPTTNIYLMDSDGTNMHRVSTERNGADKPTIDLSNGRIIYSRWLLNIDRPSNLTLSNLTRIDSLALTDDIANIWQNISIRPDGDDMKSVGTDPRNRKTFFSYRPRTTTDGKMFSIFFPDAGLTYSSNSPGIRFYDKSMSEYKYIAGTDTSTLLYIQNPPSTGTLQPPYATDPIPINSNKIIFSLTNSVEYQDYGIYMSNFDGTGIQPIADIPGKMDLNAEILAPRTRPASLPYLSTFDENLLPPTSNPSTFYQGGLFRFDCLNIFSNGPVDFPMDNAPDISANVKIQFFLNFQRQDPTGKDLPILFREEPIDITGLLAFGEAPANVSMFEQLIDEKGKVLTNSEGKLAHVFGMNYGITGSGGKCVGCHAGHTSLPIPNSINEASFTNVSTSAEVTQSSYYQNFRGENVTDRKARNTDLNVNWISDGGVNEFVELTWDLYLETREIKIYNISENISAGTNIKVNDCEIVFYKDTTEVRRIISTGSIPDEGKSIPISPVLMNRLRVYIKNYTGFINNINKSGLAEIETIAKISYANLVNISEDDITVKDYELNQNYPNPFNPTTKIQYYLPKSGFASLIVYDITGKEIATLIAGKMEKGYNTVEFKANNISSGVYIYKLTTPDWSQTKKMVLIK